MRRYTFAAVLAVLVVVTPWRLSAQAGATRYTVEDLGTVDGLVPTVTGINASGQVSGYASGSTGTRAVRYTPGRGWEILPGLSPSFSLANGINAAGDVVGYHFTPDFQLRAFRYRDGSGVEEIAPLTGGTMTIGYAINSNGDVVGYSDVPSGELLGFIARPGQAAVALPSLGGGFTLACGINDAGQIVGSSVLPSGLQHAIRIEPDATAATDIGSFNPEAQSASCAIDAVGHVGGQGENGAAMQALRFNGTVQNLDTFGSTSSNVESIANGVSVGFYAPAGSAHALAFVHSDKTGSLDLNTLLENAGTWVLVSAKAVNTDGVIVGEGVVDGHPGIFRLTPQADITAPVISSVTASPSKIWPPNNKMVDVTTTTVATDDSGKAPVCSLTGIAGPGTAGYDYVITGADTAKVRATGGSLYTLTVTCVDEAGNASAAPAMVEVLRDTKAPVINSLSATPSKIWPPNNKMVPVSVSVSASDDVDEAPTCSLSSITGGDSEITGRFTANVRASKGDDGDSRVYTLKVTCTDKAGNKTVAPVRVFICKEGASSTEVALASSSSSKKH